VDVRFFYKGDYRSYKHEVIITSFSIAVSRIIDLPEILEVCLYPLEENVYGGIDKMRVNRIGLNTNLSLESIPIILAHELIHVHQKHVGHLRIAHNGMCYWHGIPITNKPPEDMTYEEYQNLPWEVDVQNRSKAILKEALLSYNSCLTSY